jgi:thiamine monophosphate kinase
MAMIDPRRSLGLLRPALVAAALAAGGAEAHHSISAVYDSGRPVTVEGVVTSFEFVNPHPFLIVAVGGGTDDRESWRLEMDNRFELAGIGVTADTLKPGDVVVVTGSAGRTTPRSLYIRRLDRPADGFRYEQVGSRPRIN